MPEIKEIQKVEVRIPTPILQTVNSSLSRFFKRNIDELANDVNRAIERGVKTDENARDAEIIVQDARKAIRIVNEIRLEYTRPIDEAKKAFIREVDSLLRPLTESNSVLDRLLLERAREIKRKEEQARREAEAKAREAEAKAYREEERRRKISIAQGGNGDHKPVLIDKPVMPVSQIGMRSTTKTRSVVDREAIRLAVSNGVREIPGVNIFQVWQFEIIDSGAVPKEYRMDVRA